MNISDPHAAAGNEGQRRFGRTLLALALVCILALAGGFAWFLSRLPTGEVPITAGADGIVVLTGGASRVTDAIELLAKGHGRRLLISGVNPSTRAEEILRLTPEYEGIVRCCVDLDRVSRNTSDNAAETRRWAKEKGFRSLIVVTSSYHMPRALAEIGYQLPDARLIPFPVVTQRLRAEPWWSSGPTMRLVVSEYVKYIAAVARMRLETTLWPQQMAS